MLNTSKQAGCVLFLILCNFQPSFTNEEEVHITLNDNPFGEFRIADENNDLHVTKTTMTNSQSTQIFQWSSTVGILYNTIVINPSMLNTVNVSSLVNISDNCATAVKSFANNIISQSQQGLKILDATGKPEAGIQTGNLKWLGSMDSCNKVSINASENLQLKGKYCWTKLKQSEKLDDQMIKLRIAICVPDCCSDKEVHLIISQAWETLSLIASNITIPGISLLTIMDTMQPQLDQCHELPRQNYSTGFILAISFVSLVAVIIFWATFYDCVKSRLKICRIKSDALDKAVVGLSLITNIENLMDRDWFSKEDSIACLHGIRSLSMLWILLGQTYAFVIPLLDNDAIIEESFTKKLVSMVVINSSLATDTFFLLSGALVSYNIFNLIKHQPNVLKQPLFWLKRFYLNRYLRLTPTLIIFILIYTPLLEYISNGVMFPPNRNEIIDSHNCAKYGWTNILYINNFYPLEKNQTCMSHTWYLANDMQFYVLSPLLLLPFAKFGLPGGGIATLAAVLLSTTITATSNSPSDVLATLIPVNIDNLPINLGQASEYYNRIFIKPYNRISPYVIGILLGYVLQSRITVKITWYANLIIWSIVTTVALTLLLSTHHYVANRNTSIDLIAITIYWLLVRPAWALCLFWIIYACKNNLAGTIDSILCWSGFVPLSRLSYCMYLVHAVVIQMFYYTFNTKLHMTNSLMIYLFCGNVMSTVLVAIILAIFIEKPVASLIKILINESDCENCKCPCTCKCICTCENEDKDVENSASNNEGFSLSEEDETAGENQERDRSENKDNNQNSTVLEEIYICSDELEDESKEPKQPASVPQVNVASTSKQTKYNTRPAAILNSKLHKTPQRDFKTIQSDYMVPNSININNSSYVGEEEMNEEIYEDI